MTRLRIKLRRMEPEITKGVKREVARAAQDIHDASVRNFRAIDKPDVGTGDMLNSMSYNISKDGFTAVIGPGAKNAKIFKAVFGDKAEGSYKTKAAKQDRMNIMKGFWVEFGTKGAPEFDIPPMPPRPFMNPAWDANKDKLRDRIGKEVRDVLEAGANG